MRLSRYLSARTGSAPREFLRRLDRFAGDLNVLLVVVAVGLATLDFTFLITQKVIERLPPVTRVVYDQAPPVNPHFPADPGR
jgi:hypothetical protein